jgi:hypothetical protein
MDWYDNYIVNCRSIVEQLNRWLHAVLHQPRSTIAWSWSLVLIDHVIMKILTFSLRPTPFIVLLGSLLLYAYIAGLTKFLFRSLFQKLCSAIQLLVVDTKNTQNVEIMITKHVLTSSLLC